MHHYTEMVRHTRKQQKEVRASLVRRCKLHPGFESTRFQTLIVKKDIVLSTGLSNRTPLLLKLRRYATAAKDIGGGAAGRRGR